MTDLLNQASTLWTTTDARSLATYAVLAVGAYVVYSTLKANRFAKSLPPSPPGLPLIGHTHLLSGVKYSWRTFYDYSREFNAPVMSFKLGTSCVIVINGAQAAYDLLEKKSAIYSDRPRLIVVSELISNGRRMVLTPYNDRWRRMRRFLHQALQDKMAATYEPVQDRESKALMLSLVESPKQYADHIQLFSSNIILQVVYSRRAETVKDQCIQDMIHDIETWSLSALPGAHFVTDFPVLNYVPAFLAPWKRNALALHDFEMKLYNMLTAGVREKMARGELPDCLMRHLIQRQKEFELDDEDVLYLAGTMFEAGSDTTTSLTISLFLACANDPSIAKTAQAEIDRVVGDDRMPTFADLEDIPYIMAVAKELQRWRPAVPSAVPHALTEDDTYMGYHLPKGATVITNTWGIGRDTAIFPDPETFRPSRYLGEERKKIEKLLSKGHTGFGHARRICPGLHLADRSLFINIANIFWGFDIAPVAGEPLPDVDNFTRGFVSRSEKFNVSITPRSAKKAALMRSEGYSAMTEMATLYD